VERVEKIGAAVFDMDAKIAAVSEVSVSGRFASVPAAAAGFPAADEPSAGARVDLVPASLGVAVSGDLGAATESRCLEVMDASRHRD
jgi:hypothetical protein